MTDLEKQNLLSRIALAEHRSLLADVRSQLALHTVTALRNVLAARSGQFDSEFVAELDGMPPISVPSEDELNAPSKLQTLIEELQKRGSTL